MSRALVRMPSLDLVRGFVAVGRRMSITRAAEDLCVTQSAVSRQVRALETAVGEKLLIRGHRAIAFTPAGERLFRSADAALQQLQDVVGEIGAGRERAAVTVTSSIGVAGLWLLPQLGHFIARHPGIDVRVAATNRVVDLRGEGVDLAIRYCRDVHAPEGAFRLFGETLAPVAHPSLAVPSLASGEDLASHVLLEFDDPGRPWLQWDAWLAKVGWARGVARGVLRFNQYDQLIHAAVAGQGVALGRVELLGPMLADGRLVCVPTGGARASSECGYWLVQAEAAPREEVAQAVTWIRSIARATVRGAAPA